MEAAATTTPRRSGGGGICSPTSRTQLSAVLRKNVLLVTRNKGDIWRELAVPAVLMAVLAILSSLLGAQSFDAVPAYPPIPVLPLALFGSGGGGGAAPPSIWLAPCSGSAGEFVSNISAALPLVAGANATCFPCESGCAGALMDAYVAAPRSVFAALVFDNVPAGGGGGGAIAYRIRMDGSRYAPGAGATNISSLLSPTGSALPPDRSPSLWSGAVLPVLLAADAAISRAVAAAANVSPPPAYSAASTQQFPSAAYATNAAGSTLLAITPVYITLIYTLGVRVLLTRVLEEKERKIKLALRIAGLPPALDLAAWTITALVRNTLVTILIVAISCGVGVFKYSDWSLVLVFLLLFQFSCMAFSFAVAALFTRSRTGGVLGMVAWLALSAPAYALTSSSTSAALKTFLAILPPTAFSLGINILVQAEQAGVGVGWRNVGDGAVTPAGVSIGALLGMLALDAAYMSLLAYYLDAVVPTEFGIAKHPLFCLGFRKRVVSAGAESVAALRAEAAASMAVGEGGGARRRGRWCPWALRRSAALEASSSAAAESHSATSTSAAATAAAAASPALSAGSAQAAAARVISTTQPEVEQETPEQQARPGVFIRSLVKAFRGDEGVRIAVDSLDLTLREGEVTCLLGHNGAGKSTTVSVLTGLYAPTAGDAVVFGTSILEDIDAVRAMIGYCPQSDEALFDRLTVAEHLELWGGMKGLSGAALASRVDELVRELGLQPKRDALAGTLSGGQKRRLTLGLALVGQPRCLILDEATSGLDPTARRHVWGIIERYKAGGGRAVLFLTHFMDEADILGDRVALMARGRLRFCGSPLFVKSRFALGYHLTLTLAPAAAAEGGGGAPASSPTSVSWQEAALAEAAAMVREHVPGGTLSASQMTAAAAAAATGAGAAGGDAALSSATTVLEATFLLPRGEVGAYPALFEALEHRTATAAGSASSTLRVLEISASTSPLEEVFLRMTQLVEEEEARAADARKFGADGTGPAGAAAGVPPTTTPPAPTPTAAAAATSGSDERGDPRHTARLWWLDARRRGLPALARERDGGGRQRHSELQAGSSTNGSRAVRVQSSSSSSSSAYCGPDAELLSDDALEGAALLRDMAAAGVVLPPAKRPPLPRDSAAFFAQQVTVQLWRRFLQVSRDRRILVLYWAVPVIIAGVSLVFQVLSGITLPVPQQHVPFSASSFGAALPPGGSFAMPWGVVTSGVAAADDAMSTFGSAAAAAALPPPTVPLAPLGAANASASSVLSSSAAASALISNYSYAAGAVLLTANSSTPPPLTYTATLMWNTTLTQSIPTLFALWDSAVLSAAVGAPTSISAAFDAFPATATSSITVAIGAYISSSLIGLYVGMGFVTLPALQISAIVQERESRCKQLSLINGGLVTSYWTAALIADMLLSLVPVAGTVLILGVAGPSELTSANSLGSIALLLLLFIVASPGPVYALSFLFSAFTTAQLAVRLGYTLLLIGFFVGTFVMALPVVTTPTLTAVASGIEWLAILVPLLGLYKGIANIGAAGACSPTLQRIGLPCTTGAALGWDVTGRIYVALVVSTPLWLLVVLALEARALRAMSAVPASGPLPPVLLGPKPPVPEDADVIAERAAILAASERGGGGDTAAGVVLARATPTSTSTSTTTPTPLLDVASGLTTLGLRKVYPPRPRLLRRSGGAESSSDTPSADASQPIVAVEDLYLHAAEGEVLGLLGANGAGKSTTLSMLVCELAPSRGTATVFGTDIVASRSAILGGTIGYCPQNSALYEHLTAREHIQFYASLSGSVPPEHAAAVAEAALLALDLNRNADTLAKHLSGGNRRRLSLLLAYSGAPRAVYIDEASTGVDPAARHRMLDIIRSGRAGRATVATTHVMEESEAMCSKIAIMVAGRLACVGSPQHLKALYARGYYIDVSLPTSGTSGSSSSSGAGGGGGGGTGTSTYTENLSAAVALVRTAAPSATLVESHAGNLRFEATEGVRLSVVFRVLEEARQRGRVRDWGVSRATLDSVFLRFANAVAAEPLS